MGSQTSKGGVAVEASAAAADAAAVKTNGQVCLRSIQYFLTQTENNK